MGVDWWDKLKPLRIHTKGKKVPQYLKPIPELIDSFGVPFPTAQRAADGWEQSFATIEAGEGTTSFQIADIVLREAATHLARHYTSPIMDLISRRQVEEALRRTNTGSAPGPDGITVDFLQLIRTWSVIQLTTLFGKSALYIQAPIQYKGGSFFAFYKRKDAHTDTEMYRSILLADVIGKLLARAHRLANMGALASDLSGAHSWQCGGVTGLGMEFPVLAIRLFKVKTKQRAHQSHSSLSTHDKRSMLSSGSLY